MARWFDREAIWRDAKVDSSRMKWLNTFDIDCIIEMINARSSADEQVLPPTREERVRLARCISHVNARPSSADRNAQLARRAASMYYSVVKSRPLPDGNRRFAAAALAMLMIDNNYLPQWSSDDLYATAMRDDSRPGEVMRIYEDLALLIFSSIRPLTKADLPVGFPIA